MRLRVTEEKGSGALQDAPKATSPWPLVYGDFSLSHVSVNPWNDDMHFLDRNMDCVCFPVSTETQQIRTCMR